MLAPQGLMRGIVQRLLSAANPDSANVDVSLRLKKYGDQGVESVWPGTQALADEGALFTATMLPGATALQLGISAAFSAVAPAFVIRNEDVPSTTAKRVFPLLIRFLMSVAPASGTQLLMATVLDPKDRTPPTVSNGSGGTGPGTPATLTAYLSTVSNVNGDVANPSVSKIYLPMSIAAGAPPTAPAAGPSARTILGNVGLRAQIPVVLDEYVIPFGNMDPTGQLVTAAPAGASRIVSHHPPVVIPPGWSFLVYLWAPSNAAAGMAFSGIDVVLAER